jgi:hypothetical protein
MPSGYTDKLYRGEEQEFGEFAMQCARAFGALILMRDEPWDAPVPAKFEPDTRWEEEQIAKVGEKIERYTDATLMELMDEQQANRDARLADWYRYRHEADELKARYEAMLAKVEAWTPPTEEHEGLKKFMIEQLTSSIEHDCRTSKFETPDEDKYAGIPEIVPSEEYRQQKLAHVEEDLARYEKNLQDEINRAQERTNWINDLRRSLGVEVPA